MSLIYIDGFDTYGSSDGSNVTASMSEAGWIMNAQFNSTPIPSVHTDTRTGIGWSITPGAWTYGGDLKRAFPVCSGIVVGFAIKLTTANFQNICAILYNNLIGTIYTQLEVSANGENGVTVQTGDGAHIYTSPPNVLFENVWQYLELKYTPGVGTSYLEVRIDGVTVISVTNEALQTSGAASLVNMFDFTSAGGTSTLVDDLYICNTAGTNFNDFLGDCVVHSLIPLSDAGPNTMTMNGGITGQHFTTVNDVPPDNDTTYMSSDTSGQKETYNLSTITADVLQVLAVSVNTTARKQAPGFGPYKSFIVTGGVEADSGQFSAALAYIQTQFILETQPNGLPWNNASLQGSQIGFFLP